MTFIDDLEPILTDLYIDLLNIKNRNVYNDCFENLLSCGLFPRITLPTRISTTGALLGNIFTNFNFSCATNISQKVVSTVSDHLPCFYAFTTESFKTTPIKLTQM